MKSKSFSTKNDKKLIEMIRDHPVLYKSSDRNYKDNNLKENVWNEISISIGKNVNDCKTRWRTIRDSYKKNLKKHNLDIGVEVKSKSKYNNDTLSFLNNIEDARRTKSNISVKVETIDNANYSEVQNESLNHDIMEIERNEIYLDPIIETANTPFDVQVQQKSHDSKEIFKKPHEKLRARGGRGKMIKEIRKGRENRLATLKETKEAEYADNHPIQIFFKSMASTVMTFPPELAVETRMRVCKIVSEMELCSLAAKTNTPSIDTIMTSTQSSSSKQNIILAVDEDSSHSKSSILSNVSGVSKFSNTSLNSNSNLS